MSKNLSSYYKKIGVNLSKQRNKAGYSMLKLSSLLNLKETTYQKYEQGVVRLPLHILFKLSLIYNINLEEFFIGVEAKFPNSNSPIEIRSKIDPLLKEVKEKLLELENINSNYKK